MHIRDILRKAEAGALPTCGGCPWSPENAPQVGFGVSCRDHGLDWERDGARAVSMLVAQDPGNTTPHETGRLCAVHNAQNATDKTAQHADDLWRAAVALDFDDSSAGGHLKRHYWTNAIMHGAGDKDIRKKLTRARRACGEVLAAQIKALLPAVIIALGQKAALSLRGLGCVRMTWRKARAGFSRGAWVEERNGWNGLDRAVICCTYHTSAQAVNRAVAQLYAPEVERHIERKAAELPNATAVERFLAKYDQPEKRPESRGMRVLLNHWLDIGVAIRQAAG